MDRLQRDLVKFHRMTNGGPVWDLFQTITVILLECLMVSPCVRLGSTVRETRRR